LLGAIGICEIEHGWASFEILLFLRWFPFFWKVASANWDLEFDDVMNGIDGGFGIGWWAIFEIVRGEMC